jgi:hypothetical protein
MANTFNVPIACSNIGSGVNMSCCYPNDQNDSICDSLFPLEGGFLQNGCLTNNCINKCTDLSQLYGSRLQHNLTGNGEIPIAQYMACANLPSIASYANQGVLSPSITKSIQPYILPNTADNILQTITEVVTDCVSSTCRRSRNSSFCYLDYCSPVKLLRNNTSPDIEAINTCLDTMCSQPMRSLPYADADVIGIGVGGFDLTCNYEIANPNSISGLLLVHHAMRIHHYSLARFLGLCHISAQKRRT